jgi:hypothetical protein
VHVQKAGSCRRLPRRRLRMPNPSPEGDLPDDLLRFEVECSGIDASELRVALAADPRARFVERRSLLRWRADRSLGSATRRRLVDAKVMNPCRVVHAEGPMWTGAPALDDRVPRTPRCPAFLRASLFLSNRLT